MKFPIFSPLEAANAGGKIPQKLSDLKIASCRLINPVFNRQIPKNLNEKHMDSSLHK